MSAQGSRQEQNLKIFISWSGEISEQVALQFRDWLPAVLPPVEPWVSSEDIEKGTRWSAEIAKQLEAASFGIICIDSTNIASPWLNFEAGAISKTIDNTRVMPFLLDIEPKSLAGPLAQF